VAGERVAQIGNRQRCAVRLAKLGDELGSGSSPAVPSRCGSEVEESHQDLPSIPTPLLPLRQQWVAHSACIFSIRWKTARPLELKRVCSSVVEQETLNLLVVGSTPTEPTNSLHG
jgi:hypothetical protein